MPYSEQDGQVVLTMTREDYQRILLALGAWVAAMHRPFEPERTFELLEFVNRLNEGNPNFTPYQVNP